MDTGMTLALAALVVIVVLLVVVVLLLRRHPKEVVVDEETVRRIVVESTSVGRPSPAEVDRATAAVVAPPADDPAPSQPPSARRHAAVEPEAVSPAAPAVLPATALTADAVGAERGADRQADAAWEIAKSKLAAEEAAIAVEKERLAEATRLLHEDQKRLAAEQERLRSDRADVERQRHDIAGREKGLRERMAAADARQVSLDQARLEVEAAQLDIEATRVELAQQRERQCSEHEAELVRISSLTVEDARAELLQSQEEAVRRDAAKLIRSIETEAQTTAKQRARRIISDAIQRVASDQTAQTVVSAVHLPSDELKGRIIGREGRNIRAFETVTGVNVIVDDTPESVLLSCFDPVRREIGRVTLQMLIDDGRIHPHRIEEAYERAQEEVEGLCLRAAEDALLEVGISDLHPELMALVGQLKYRTSYGQNVLGHSIETSHIARLMAAELGIEPTISARGAFLHDIGKALTHEAQGSHAIVGAEVARKYGESAEVVHCIEAHHDEVPPATVEAVITQAADASSGGRPGARRESLEAYVKRLEHLEAIASAKKGVDKVFAMQAGRELRVMVKPDQVDDLEAHVMAREVAKQIEEELTYPGQVRVTVVRESRATEVAR